MCLPPSVLKVTFIYIFISLQITRACMCYITPPQRAKKKIFHIYICIHVRLKVCGRSFSPVLQRNFKTSNQTACSLTVRSAAGPESISDGGRIILAKRVETFQTTSVSRTKITRPVLHWWVQWMHDLSELLLLLLMIVHKGQLAAGLRLY